MLWGWRMDGAAACQVGVFNGVCLSRAVHVSAMRCHGAPRIDSSIEYIFELAFFLLELMKKVQNSSEGSGVSRTKVKSVDVQQGAGKSWTGRGRGTLRRLVARFLQRRQRLRQKCRAERHSRTPPEARILPMDLQKTEIVNVRFPCT